MEAKDLIRLAWEAEHDGRHRLRDSLLTLAVAESRPGDAWAERCRARLVRERPDHFLGHFASVPEALEDPRVVDARDRLRIKYPESRVRWLLLRARAARGPYLGRVESLEAMIEDLAGPPAGLENVRLDAAQVSRGPIQLKRATRPLAWALVEHPIASGLERHREGECEELLPDWPEDEVEPPVEDFATYYLTVLLAIAFLLASVERGASARA